MRYVGGNGAEGDCIFCRRLAAADDVQSLILHRGERAFAIMNLFPYNTGHVMLVPTKHVASPEQANPAALEEIAGLLPPCLRALRRVLGCDGFNIGMNVGAVAGAGIADHLHQHVVPRWEGDANFMPILASTMVLPELIPVTYAKVRAELARELYGTDDAACVALTNDHAEVLVEERHDGWRLPVAHAGPDEALWRAARRMAGALTESELDVAGWAGPRPADQCDVALTLESPSTADRRASSNGRWLPVAETASGQDAPIVAAAIAQLAPAAGGP